MSLINQMLKDIDKRQGAVPSSLAENVTLRMSESSDRSRKSLGALGLISVAALAVGATIWFWPQPTPPVVMTMASAKPVGAASAPVVRPPAAVVQPPAGVVQPPHAVVQPPSTVVQPPSAAVQAPSAVVQAPSAVVQAPSAVVRPPTVAVQPPAGVAQPPVAVTQAPSRNGTALGMPAFANAAKPMAAKPELGSRDLAKADDAKAAPPADVTLKTDLKPAELTAGSVSRVVTPEQRADNAYREAVNMIRVGRTADAQRTLQSVLRDNPAQVDARQLLARVMLENGQNLEAKALLTEGLSISPQSRTLYVALAHAQIQSNDLDGAIGTLESGMPQAGDNPEYHAMMAALVQQKGRHEVAVQQYVLALRQTPDNANWLVGLGVSLQAMNNRTAAAEAFQRALDLGLPSSLSTFTQERLRQLQR